MPPPPPSPLLLRGSLHPVRGGVHHFQTTRISEQITSIRSFSNQSAATALPLSLSRQCAPHATHIFLTQSPTSNLRSRPFFTTPPAQSGDSHGPHYDTPQGWLFGIPPGQKYEKEGWENMWVYGFWGSLLFGVVGYAYKPDTSYVFFFLSFLSSWSLERGERGFPGALSIILG